MGWGNGCVGVYPRVCGGTMLMSGSVMAVKGLSPRVRGNLDLPPLIVGRGGSIPACAGEPNRFLGRE